MLARIGKNSKIHQWMRYTGQKDECVKALCGKTAKFGSLIEDNSVSDLCRSCFEDDELLVQLVGDRSLDLLLGLPETSEYPRTIRPKNGCVVKATIDEYGPDFRPYRIALRTGNYAVHNVHINCVKILR